MAKRKKRLEKAIKSLQEQKEIHREKRKQAQEAGDENLVRYYDKELVFIDEELKDKDDKLHRKD